MISSSQTLKDSSMIGYQSVMLHIVGDTTHEKLDSSAERTNGGGSPRPTGEGQRDRSALEIQ